MHISIENNGKCSWDRCSTHDKYMRLFSFSKKGFSLTDSKPVLLIRDHKNQLLINHLFLDQGTGADYDIIITFFNSGTSFFLFSCGNRTGKKYRFHRQMISFCHMAQLFIMLSCQNFRRSHHGSLTAISCHKEKRKKSKDRFSTSYISLYKPVHDYPACQIIFDFLPGTHLCLRQLIGKSFQQSAGVGSFQERKG